VIYPGTVTRIDDDGFVYVLVPRLSRGEKGPLEPLYGVATPAGTRVLVGRVEDDPDRLVLLRRF
jgi:hypothetical protein